MCTEILHAEFMGKLILQPGLCTKVTMNFEERLRYTPTEPRWIREYKKQRRAAYLAGKLWPHVTQESYSSYILHGRYPNGSPILPIIWQHDLGPRMLDDVLSAGVDLDSEYISHYIPPPEYAQVLESYGWNSGNDVQPFYRADLWTPAQRAATYTVKPIETITNSGLGKRIVTISDTHWNHRKLTIPDGDILICAGDIALPWIKDLTDFFRWMGSFPHPHKIMVAGNHDKLVALNKEYYLSLCEKYGIHYLEDSGLDIDGIKIWGSPWTPIRPRNKNNAFTMSRRKLIGMWDMIPADTNILITHCPPYGVGDGNTDWYSSAPYQSGDFGLYKTINRLTELKLHIFGHQHFERGMYKSNTGVYFVNTAVVYDPRPFVIN